MNIHDDGFTDEECSKALGKNKDILKKIAFDFKLFTESSRVNMAVLRDDLLELHAVFLNIRSIMFNIHKKGEDYEPFLFSMIVAADLYREAVRLHRVGSNILNNVYSKSDRLLSIAIKALDDEEAEITVPNPAKTSEVIGARKDSSIDKSACPDDNDDDDDLEADPLIDLLVEITRILERLSC